MKIIGKKIKPSRQELKDIRCKTKKILKCFAYLCCVVQGKMTVKTVGKKKIGNAKSFLSGLKQIK